jgi:DNA-binding MarR family transcriptional regulator
MCGTFLCELALSDEQYHTGGRLYERPIMSVNQIRDLTGTTYPAANQLVDRLVKINVLSEITGQARHRRFRYDAYVRLFDEPD